MLAISDVNHTDSGVPEICDQASGLTGKSGIQLTADACRP